MSGLMADIIGQSSLAPSLIARALLVARSQSGPVDPRP